MKVKKSKRFEFDLKNIKDIIIASLIAVSGFYISNTEVVNATISKYVSNEALPLIICIIGYATKKFITDYSKMEHKCLKEIELALLTKTNFDMVERVKKIEDNVESIKTDITNIKDFIGTVNLSIQKDNANIRELLNSGFAEIKLNFEKEREVAIKNTKERVKNNYANKIVEKIIYTLGGAVGLALLTSLLKLIIK